MSVKCLGNVKLRRAMEKHRRVERSKGRERSRFAKAKKGQEKKCKGKAGCGFA